MPATGFRTMLGLCRRLVSSCGAAARPPQARGGFQRAATVARAGEHRSWPPLGLPFTVRARRFDEGFTGHGERLRLVRAYGKGGYDDEYWDDEDEDDPAWYEDDEDFDETPLNDKGPKDVETLRGISGPRVADTLPMPEPGECTDPPRKVTKDDVTISFARSGGAGGQNVNKVNTKVDMRLHLERASDWLHPWVARRLMVLEKNRVNKDGELVIQSSRFRTQSQNVDDALEKMQACLNRASKLPQQKANKTAKKKLVKQAEKANKVRLENKKRGSDKKKLRNKKNIEWD